MVAFDVRRLDVYRKVPKDLTQPTYTGAIISIICCTFIVILIVTELTAFLTTQITSELFVENNENDDTERILVRINISVLRLNCDYIGLDIQDDMGRHEVGFVEDTQKIPIIDGKGCRFEGRFYINKVPGNFHVSTHSAHQQPDHPDMAHIIHELTFGDEISGIPGGFNALGGRQKQDAQSVESHEYHMKIVPTIYEDLRGNELRPYQYTSAYKSFISFSHTGRILPAIWFRYDLSPITVKYTERRRPFYHFLTTICAIVGGAFTVAGIIDSIVFTAHEIFRKIELGKIS